jgi:glucose-1-phosphate adenylyltransferase
MKTGKTVAMLLAGGQGSRLKALTRKVAKPAVPFGGKYRIIDFAVSNCANSNIRDLGILTQYKPLLLNEHLGIGAAWDYDKNKGGLRVLSPFTGEEGGRWFTGTANAIFENIDFLDEVNPEYVLILSGDHIYKMNYDHMLDYHREKGADCTIAVIEVEWEDASRFGILNTDENDQVVEFDEKPAEPKNNLASMGIYMFTWKELREALYKDEKNPDSDNDFGKNVLPMMLDDGKKMFSYRFSGYWKDVGTVRSYWESNMDLLDPNNTLQIYDDHWRIYTKSKNLPPQYLAEGSTVRHSMVNEGCVISGTVENSILFSSVIVEEGAVVKNSIILSDCVIKSGAKLNRAITLEGLVVDGTTEIGQDEDDDCVYLMHEDGVTKE